MTQAVETALYFMSFLLSPEALKVYMIKLTTNTKGVIR